MEANPSQVEYKWFRDGVEVEGANSATLPLGMLSRKDHGKPIACEAKNSIGSIRKSQTLSVKCKFNFYFIIRNIILSCEILLYLSSSILS